ncbi:MAG: hypothetical protein ACRDD1_01720, partial [Planctomycetia bacterium]
ARLSEEAAEKEADEALQAAQKRLDDAVAKVEGDAAMSTRQKDVILENIRRTEQRKLEVTKSEIDGQKKQKLREVQGALQQQIQAVQSKIKLTAVLVPPIPALLIGMLVFFARVSGEREGANPKRLV